MASALALFLPRVRIPLKPRNPFFRAFSQLLKLRFTAMVTYTFHLYSRSSHHFILCKIDLIRLAVRSKIHLINCSKPFEGAFYVQVNILKRVLMRVLGSHFTIKVRAISQLSVFLYRSQFMFLLNTLSFFFIKTLKNLAEPKDNLVSSHTFSQIFGQISASTFL